MNHQVLIVDDEPIIANTFEAILRSTGYEAKATYSSEQALALIAKWQPDLAIVDVILPGLNGIEFGKLLRAQCPECRLILISGQTSTAELLEESAKHGYRFEILAKPMHPTVLLERIAGLFSHSADQGIELPSKLEELNAVSSCVRGKPPDALL